MSPRHSPDEHPTTVQQETAVQPAVTTLPATRRSRLWPGGRLPARIGRARTSTLVLAGLFVLLFALYFAVRPDPVEYTTVTTTSGQTLRVPASDVLPPPTTSVPAPPSTPVETTAPATPTTDTTPPTTSAAPTSGNTTTTTTPGRSRTPTTAASTSEEPTSAAPRARTPAPSSAVPSATSEAPAGTVEPTG
jgi:hypothetical protein